VLAGWVEPSGSGRWEERERGEEGYLATIMLYFTIPP
jgi:hypothetical protein